MMAPLQFLWNASDGSFFNIIFAWQNYPIDIHHLSREHFRNSVRCSY